MKAKKYTGDFCFATVVALIYDHTQRKFLITRGKSPLPETPVRQNESLESALRRAIKESTGMESVWIPSAPLGVQTAGNGECVRIYYRCGYTGEETNGKTRWVEAKELKKDPIAEYLHAF